MIDGIRRDPGRDTLQCPCHMACGIAGYPITINILPGEEKLIVTSPALAWPMPAGAPGRSPARVKYIVQRA